MTALLLAGVRNIPPRPMGFTFHAVLVVNSAYLASQNSPDGDRGMPIFWALDQFKGSQARDVQEGVWTMAPVAEGRVTKPEQARGGFVTAMEGWDEERADSAVAGLVRSVGAQEVFDLMCRYGARDFRDIGHKAIIEDYRHLSPAVRHRYLAGCTAWLEGSGQKDSPLVARTRAALG